MNFNAAAALLALVADLASDEPSTYRNVHSTA